jgi:hypothetical protein
MFFSGVLNNLGLCKRSLRQSSRIFTLGLNGRNWRPVTTITRSEMRKAPPAVKMGG